MSEQATSGESTSGESTSGESTRAPDPGAAAAARRRRLLVPVISLSGSAVLLALIGIVLWTAARPVEPAADGTVRFGAAPGQPLPYRTVPPGTPAAPIKLTGLDGRTVDLAAYKGRPVVVNFWASWCEPCKRELPLLAAAKAARAPDGLVILGVAVRDDPGSARAMAARYHVDWPVALDPDDTVAAAYQVAVVPQTFFVRPDGTVASQQPGELSRAGLDAQLEAIIP